MNFVSAKEAREFFKITGPTLMHWRQQGLINIKQFSSRKILYDIDSFQEDSSVSIQKRRNLIYARVSSSKQTEDLNRQIESLKSYCNSIGIIPNAIYKDIGSGMNEDRKELNMLITEVLRGDVDKVFISFKDRLTRFGFKYFKNLFERFNTEIVILDEFEESNKTFQDELTEDLISIIHHYSMKLYSNRRKKFKEIENIISAKEG